MYHCTICQHEFQGFHFHEDENGDILDLCPNCLKGSYPFTVNEKEFKNPTIYNHNLIGDKPLIKNSHFKRLYKSVKRNGFTVVQEWLNHVSITNEQINLLKSINNQI